MAKKKKAAHKDSIIVEPIAETVETVTSVEEKIEEIAPEVEAQIKEEVAPVKVKISGEAKDITMAALFNTIALKENATLELGKIYHQKTDLAITGKDGELIKITGLMIKEEFARVISFVGDYRPLVAADGHIVRVAGEEVKVEDLLAGQKLDTVTGTREIESVVEGGVVRVYDLQVDDSEHLYSDASGLIHHNTYDVTKTLKTEGLSEGSGYKYLKGKGTTTALFATLHKNSRIVDGKTQVIVFDDYDSVLEDKDALNFFKAALDSNSPRIVTNDVASPNYFKPSEILALSDWTDPVFGDTHAGDFPDQNNKIYKALEEGCSGDELIDAFEAEGWGDKGANLADDKWAAKKSQKKLEKKLTELLGSKLKPGIIALYFNHETEEDVKMKCYEAISSVILKPLIPSSFVFDNKAIFITNLNLDNPYIKPLLSRSGRMEINLNATELVDRIKMINDGGGFKEFCDRYEVNAKKINVVISAFEKKRDLDPDSESGALNIRAFTNALGVMGMDKHIKGDPDVFANRYFG